jgi:hypothetical protein
MSKKRTCILMIGVAAFFCAGPALAGPGIAPIGSKITTVKTYADLGAEWFQWAVQAPATDNPVDDKTGAKCRVGQEGPVWFLAGTRGSGETTVRQCEVPGDKAIFFPLINSAWFAFLNDPPGERTAEFVRNKAEVGCDANSIRNLSVTIDGVPVARPDRYLTAADQSPLFQAQLPTDNIFGLTEDDAKELLLSPSAHQGFYLYLKPLPVGEHTIAWTATWDCNFDDTPESEPQSENITYNLKVLSGVTGLEE